MGDGIEELGKFFHEHNPFAIRTAKGKLLTFKDYRTIYLYVLVETRKYCKRGYIEYPVLLQHLTNLPIQACEEYNERALKKFPLLRQSCIVADWEHINSAERLFRQIIGAMHLITDSFFDTYSFEFAWEEFKTKINELNDEIRKEIANQ